MTQQIRSVRESLNQILDFKISQINTINLGHVLSYDSDAQTVEVKPIFPEYFEADDGTVQKRVPPVLPDVHVHFKRWATGHEHYHPAKGDLVILLCVQRSTDEWYGTDGKQEVSPVDERTHHPSDYLALVGISTKTNKIDSPPDGYIVTDNDSHLKLDGEAKIKASNVRLGSDGASIAVAKSDVANSRLDALESKVNEIIASSIANAGLVIGVTPLTPGSSTASSKVFVES